MYILIYPSSLIGRLSVWMARRRPTGNAELYVYNPDQKHTFWNKIHSFIDEKWINESSDVIDTCDYAYGYPSEIYWYFKMQSIQIGIISLIINRLTLWLWSSISCNSKQLYGGNSSYSVIYLYYSQAHYDPFNSATSRWRCWNTPVAIIQRIIWNNT